jgi:hypothetical protein
VNRKPAVGIAGVIAASVLVVIIAANSLGGSPTPSPIAQVSVPPTASPEPSAIPSATPIPTPIPTATPIPTPILVPAPLTGDLVPPAVAARHPIAVMIDDLGPARPQSGLSSASVVWQAPAEGGIPRYMAIFQENLPATIGPVRSSRLYYIAWAAEWRAVYAHSGGSPQALATLRAKGSGQYVYNADEFRYSGTFHRVTTRFPPHNLYTSGANLRALGKRLGAADKLATAIWHFAPDAPLDQRPYGGSITVGYPQNVIRYTDQHVPALGDRREEGDRCRDGDPDRTQERDRDADGLRPTQRRPSGGTAARGDHRRQRRGLDIDQRPHDQGDLEEDRHDQADQVLRRRGPRGDPDDRADLRPGPDPPHAPRPGQLHPRE